MPHSIRYFAIAVIAIFATSASSLAGSPVPTNKWEAAEKNYIKSLSSENDGVRISAAGFLGRYQFKGSVDTLIRMLQTDKVEAARSAAAVALIMIHEESGIKAVEEASLYDGSDKVAAFCTRLLTIRNIQAYTTLTGQE